MRAKPKQSEPIYPYHEWQIIEDSFDVGNTLRNETIFTVGNGYIGIRGNFEEGYNGPQGTSVEGTYLNGFYESKPIVYEEEAYGYAKQSQTMLNVTNSKIVKLYVNNELFDLFSGKVLSYKRVLNMKTGVLTRDITWQSPSDKQVRISIKRLASLSHKHLAAISYSVTPLNFSGEIRLISAVDGEVRNQAAKGDPRVGSAFSGQVLQTEGFAQTESFAAIRQKTRQTGFTLVCAMDNHLAASSEYQIDTELKGQTVAVKYTVQAKQDENVRLDKFITYYTSRDYPETDLMELAKQTVFAAKQQGFEELLSEQQAFLHDYWYRNDVEIRGDLALQQSIRFNEFHLLQSVGRDGKTNIAAKGITGEGYEGHYFWDTETYVFPYFLYTQPEIARKLLEYRYSILDKARKRAKEMSQKGALYPWRTIGGEETSAYYPAGTAQYHINADIIYALKKYMAATDDMDFFMSAGAEMLFETARLWEDLGDYIPRKGNRFCINDVTGPDEYTAIVNNNLYTNIMAKDHLEFAVRMARLMRDKYPDEYWRIAEKIKLSENEIEAWQKAADSMYIPYDEKLGIHPQDDSFLDKAVWNFENTPEENYPLLLHYHPLVIYRYQVLKQADVILALFLQGDRFTAAEKKRNFDYYEPITTHDSSLSPCSYSIIAAEIGYLKKAYDYFMQSARMDLDDYNNNVKDGIHTASMAGAWLSIINGFAGFREYGGQLSFNPNLPEHMEGYRFKITFRGRLLDVDVTKDTVTYLLIEGDPMTIKHGSQPIRLVPGDSTHIDRNRKLQAVIFDLDGVITDTAEYHYLAWKKLAGEIGVPFDRGVEEKLKGIGRMESLERILEQSDKEFTYEQKMSLAVRKNEFYLELIQGISKKDLLPGIENLLEQLKQRGIKIALASASKNARTVIEKLQIGDYFDALVDAAKIKKGKPDPEIFITAAEMLGIPFQYCIGIEDAEAGITAIKGANMFAVGVGKQGSMRQADWIVSEVSQLTFERLAEELRKFEFKI